MKQDFIRDSIIETFHASRGCDNKPYLLQLEWKSVLQFGLSVFPMCYVQIYSGLHLSETYSKVHVGKFLSFP
jgi:hypothetical protein